MASPPAAYKQDCVASQRPESTPKSSFASAESGIPNTWIGSRVIGEALDSHIEVNKHWATPNTQRDFNFGCAFDKSLIPILLRPLLAVNRLHFDYIGNFFPCLAVWRCHKNRACSRNIYPELKLPGKEQVQLFQPWHSRKRNYLRTYQLKLSESNLYASVVALKRKNQIWHETDKSEIILDRLLCLEAFGDTEVVINKCHEMLGDQLMLLSELPFIVRLNWICKS
uniref:Uncharacterized protein n=1 Tax=Glossina brevipalpis TaxID=37001 RepID=A0A1A9X2P5_9MUSC